MDFSSNDKKVVEQFREEVVDVLPDGEKWSLWRRIEWSIGRRILFARYTKWAAAASIALLLSMGYIWYSGRQAPDDPINMLVVETQAQQKQKILLPDSTIVWLNAGSRIEYPENFMAHRFVRMEGEAYFQLQVEGLAKYAKSRFEAVSRQADTGNRPQGLS